MTARCSVRIPDLDALRRMYPASTPGIATYVPELIEEVARLREDNDRLTKTVERLLANGFGLAETVERVEALATRYDGWEGVERGSTIARIIRDAIGTLGAER